MTTVHIAGAGGYAAAELIRLLDPHPDVRVGTLMSRSAAGKRVCDVFPSLPHLTQHFDDLSAIFERTAPGDIVFLAADRELAEFATPQLLDAGARVIDLADTFRFDPQAHGAVYGFPERYRDAIAGARLVANPGCYPTASLLALAPLGAFAGRIAAVVIDAKSGITGAGRSPKTPSLFAEVDGDVRAYGLGGHRHGPEIVQELHACGIEAPLAFAPHVVPLSRGMLADVYLIPSAPLDRDAILATLRRAYASSPFVTVFEDGRPPYLPALEKTNDAQLSVFEDAGIIHLLSGIDNLGKGAAGQAVQNMNIMLGIPEDRGLGAHRTVVG
ncbi:MAG: N-acetyl-gamma-glutamyl-phosphate reductase [Candidatus Velthaea sp.]